MTASALAKPSKSYDSIVMSESAPWMRSRIFSENPAMTALTTIIVATPSRTLTMLARAMYRVRRYRQQRRYLYKGPLLPGLAGRKTHHGGTESTEKRRSINKFLFLTSALSVPPW